MGQIGAKISDIAIVTSDNPRTEDPGKILQDILKGVDSAKNNYKVIASQSYVID